MKYICGVCDKEFEDDEHYRKHICKVTGFRADTVEHLDATSSGKFSIQAEEARKRGKERHQE